MGHPALVLAQKYLDPEMKEKGRRRIERGESIVELSLVPERIPEGLARSAHVEGESGLETAVLLAKQ